MLKWFVAAAMAVALAQGASAQDYQARMVNVMTGMDGRLDQHETRIRSLEGRVTELEGRISALESKYGGGYTPTYNPPTPSYTPRRQAASEEYVSARRSVCRPVVRYECDD